MALDREKVCGSIKEGNRADLILWNAPDEDVLIHEFANDVPRTVFAAGKVVSDSQGARTERSGVHPDQGV